MGQLSSAFLQLLTYLVFLVWDWSEAKPTNHYSWLSRSALSDPFVIVFRIMFFASGNIESLFSRFSSLLHLVVMEWLRSSLTRNFIAFELRFHHFFISCPSDFMEKWFFIFFTSWFSTVILHVVTCILFTYFIFFSSCVLIFDVIVLFLVISLVKCMQKCDLMS